MKRLLRALVNRAWYVYHRLRSSWLVWFYILNREPRRVWLRFRPELGRTGSEVVAALKRDGIAFSSAGELFSPQTLEELRRHALLRLAEAERLRPEPVSSGSESGGKNLAKDFILHIWGGGGTFPELDLQNPFILLALNEKILAMAGAYLGVAPKFSGFSLQSTLLVPSGSAPRLSQRWHRDPDDKKLVKIFLYLSDVEDEGAGPFSYLRGSQLGGRWRDLFPQRPPVGSYPPDGAVERIIPPEDRRPCLGRAGTLIFCDTSGLHRGGFSTTAKRLIFVATFVSNASLFPVNYRRPTYKEISHLSPLARYALTP